jgi:hypothetical protein
MPMGKSDPENGECSRKDEMLATKTTSLMHKTALNPEDQLLREEEKEIAKSNVDILFEATDEDPKIEAVLSAIVDGCEPKPRFLAGHLGIPVKDVNNRIKRLRRLAYQKIKKADKGGKL